MDEVIDRLTFYSHHRFYWAMVHVSPMRFGKAWLASEKRQVAGVDKGAENEG
jgi:hypothetical protein